MANKRMFSKEVTNSDEFLDMPLSSQALYFHLGMNADDDWFVQPRSIMRLIQAKDDEMRILIARRFVIEFEWSVIVITHWKKNNEIRKDRARPTLYQKQLQSLCLDSDVYQLTTNWQPIDNQMPDNCPPSIVEISVGEERGEEKLSSSFLDFRIQYPLKEWTAKAKEHFKKKIKTQNDYDDLINWLQWYIAVVKAKNESGFPLAYQQWSTFMSKETRKDYLSDEVLNTVQSAIPLDQLYKTYKADEREAEEKRPEYCKKYGALAMREAQQQYNKAQSFSI